MREGGGCAPDELKVDDEALCNIELRSRRGLLPGGDGTGRRGGVVVTEIDGVEWADDNGRSESTVESRRDGPLTCSTVGGL